MQMTQRGVHLPLQVGPGMDAFAAGILQVGLLRLWLHECFYRA